MEATDFVRIEQFIYRFWATLDRGDYPAVLDMLEADCRWLREGWVVGREAIERSLNLRPPTFFARHVLANMILDEAAPGAWSANYMVLSFIGSPVPGGSAILPSRPPALMADMRMRLTRSGGVIRISEIDPTITFKDMTTPEAARLPGANQAGSLSPH